MNRRSLLAIACIALLMGCTAMPARRFADTALMVYTEGSRHDTLAVTLPADAIDVYNAFIRAIEQQPTPVEANRNDDAMLIEINKADVSITGQATSIGKGESLLYIWTDAGDSGHSGRELAVAVAEAICDELGVSYETVRY